MKKDALQLYRQILYCNANILFIQVASDKQFIEIAHLSTIYFGNAFI